MHSLLIPMDAEFIHLFSNHQSGECVMCALKTNLTENILCNLECINACICMCNNNKQRQLPAADLCINRFSMNMNAIKCKTHLTKFDVQ